MKREVFFLLILLLTGLACTAQQQEAAKTLVAEQVAPAPDNPAAVGTMPSPEFSVVTLPTAPPTMTGPMGTLTAIAPMMERPTLDPRPYVIENRGKPHFVEFFAFWCGPCSEMRPSVRRIEEAYGDVIDFHFLNIDLPSTRDLAMQFHVRGVPTIVLLDAEGRLMGQFIGFQSDDQLQVAVDLLLVDGTQ
ncbi:MAG TPA: thioredoxin domain-containing protein [Aggregatilineaceae bacterium]|nr:thioredoxin domain-containing protein [Aggregatilineaceae bacterium]